MNHAIDGDVTDSYTNVPALFASLLEAQEQISNFIWRNTLQSQRHDDSGSNVLSRTSLGRS